MATAVAVEELPETLENATPSLPDEVESQVWPAEHSPARLGSTAVKAIAWAAIVGVLALGGLWSRVTPFEVAARFLVAAGAIIVMARSLLTGRYAVVAVAGALVLLYNPLAPLFGLSGDWTRAVVVAAAAPFLAALIWRDTRRRSAQVSACSVETLPDPVRTMNLGYAGTSSGGTSEGDYQRDRRQNRSQYISGR